VNPGSAEAIAKGCTCPIIDNAHGSGQEGKFWIAQGCPIHGDAPRPTTVDIPHNNLTVKVHATNCRCHWCRNRIEVKP
jgi:hypothetical protein